MRSSIALIPHTASVCDTVECNNLIILWGDEQIYKKLIAQAGFLICIVISHQR